MQSLDTRPLPPPEIETIQVTDTVSLKFDLEDGWFGIEDADRAYDEVGAVLMDLGAIDKLIVALGQLREKVRK